jgi:transposase
MTDRPKIHSDLWNFSMSLSARAAVEALISYQDNRIAELETRNAQLEARIKGLEARLGQNSSNSSLPPSSDRPDVKRAPPKKPSGKKKGGQPGHPKRSRPRLPPDQVVDLRPNACDGCGQPLTGDDPDPLIHQVVEIPPPPMPQVIEYRQHRLCCSGCGQVTCPSRPAEAQSGYGPRVQAIAALLSGAYRIGKRGVARLLRELFGVPISPAAVCKLERRTAAALGPVVAEVQLHLVGRPANVDETTWTEGRKSSWLWAAVSRWVTAFRIRPSRKRVELAELIPGPLGLLTTDRLSVYDHLGEDSRQVCWSHLQRDFQAMIDRKDDGSRIGQGLLRCADRVLRRWKRVRDGTLSREAFREHTLPRVSAVMSAWLARGSGCSKKVRNECYEFSQLGKRLWQFAWVEGVEPTNNAVERALRQGVQWRKMSYGTDSAWGSRFVERILTAVESCRQQGRNLLSFLIEVVQAARDLSTPPSLVPVEALTPQA